MMLKLGMLKGLPLLPSKFWEKLPSRGGKTALKEEAGNAFQVQLASKFPDEVIAALKVIITVHYITFHCS